MAPKGIKLNSVDVEFTVDESGNKITILSPFAAILVRMDGVVRTIFVREIKEDKLAEVKQLIGALAKEVWGIEVKKK